MNAERREFDDLGRPAIAEGMKRQIDEAFKAVTPGRRAVVLVIHDLETQQTRGHFAARLGEHWKVAGGPGFDWAGKKPTGWIGIGAEW